MIGVATALKIGVDLWSKARSTAAPEAAIQLALAQLEGRLTGRVDLLAQSASQTARTVERLEESSRADTLSRAQLAAHPRAGQRAQCCCKVAPA